MVAHNLWAIKSCRNPSIGWNGVFNFVNNVVYNWVHRSSDGGDYTAKFNMINNYYKPGPATPTEGNIGHRILKPEAGRSKLDHKVYGRVYAEGSPPSRNGKTYLTAYFPPATGSPGLSTVTVTSFLWGTVKLHLNVVPLQFSGMPPKR